MTLSPALQNDATPSFVLSTFNDGEGNVTLIVHTPEDPSLYRHASPAVLYGLALMELDKSGVIGAMYDHLLEDGPINEVDAVNRITLCLAGSEHADGD